MDLASPKKLSDFISSDPTRMGGEMVFKGTRVPIRSLFDHLRDGISLDEFLDDFQGVTREHAQAVIELAEAELLAASLAA